MVQACSLRDATGVIYCSTPIPSFVRVFVVRSVKTVTFNFFVEPCLFLDFTIALFCLFLDFGV